MKNLLFLSLFAIVLCSSVTSCKKKNDRPASSFSAKINGVPFSTVDITTTLYSGYKIIKAVKASSNESITLLLSDNSSIYSTGVYTNGGVPDSAISFSVVSATGNSANSESGVFDFVTKNSVDITEGMYSVYW